MNKIDSICFIKNIFSGKYSKEDIIHNLANLEKDREFFVKVIKKYQPKYYIKADNSISSFSLAKDLKLFTR